MARRKEPAAAAPRMTVSTWMRSTMQAGAGTAEVRCSSCGQPMSDRSAHCLRLEVSPRRVPSTGGEPIVVLARIACGRCATVNEVSFEMTRLDPAKNRLSAMVDILSCGVTFEIGGPHGQ